MHELRVVKKKLYKRIRAILFISSLHVIENISRALNGAWASNLHAVASNIQLF